MKIKRVECEQFAGMNGREVAFGDGLNLIVGDNESGKSTTVDLIYNLFFHDTKLNKNSDKEFIAKYFPQKVSGVAGDVIDGVLVFETDKGVYKLRKEWDNGEGSCRLTLPDGTSIKGIQTINEILTEELKHRAGVYNEIVFASQKRNQLAVESIMGALTAKGDDTRDDLTSTLTRASLETGGVSLDKIEKAITDQINKLCGKWDIEKNVPEGGIKRASYTNAWANKVGEIAKLYYKLDENKKKLTDTENYEEKIAEENTKCQKWRKEREAKEQRKDAFVKVKGMIEKKASIEKVIDSKEKEHNDQEDAFKKWPVIMEEIKTAKDLNKKLSMANSLALYNNLLGLKEDAEKKSIAFDKLVEVSNDDVDTVHKLIKDKQKEENKLSGMNLVAKMKTLGDANIEVRTANGELVNIETDSISISEAVTIVVPGVMELQLMPQGIDMDTVNENIAVLENSINSIYVKYDVANVDELQNKANEYKETKYLAETAKEKFIIALGERNWNDIEAEVNKMSTDVEPLNVITAQIADLCGGENIESYIGRKEGAIENYERRYISLTSLEDLMHDTEKSIETERKNLDEIEAIPEEYKNITDTNKYEIELIAEIKSIDSHLNSSNDKKGEYLSKLGENSSEYYTDEIRKLEEEFEAMKSELAHWLNIRNVFNDLKEQTGNVSITDIEDNFKNYLNLISDGKLNLTSMDEQLSVKLSSGTNALSYNILSDGTKDTVSLAFRLAMLEHLYPNGNGLAVFDDPFTDMDPKRVEQSCKLIKKFAERNQVIFITCDEKYKEMLSGNIIEIN